MSVNCLSRSENPEISLGAEREDGMRMPLRGKLNHKQNPKLGSEIRSTMYCRSMGRKKKYGSLKTSTQEAE